MRNFSVDDFMTPERQSACVKSQLNLMSNVSTPDRKIVRRPRDPEELKLILQAIRDDLNQLEQEGKLKRDGHTWKFFV